jgi:hypothetical protein
VLFDNCITRFLASVDSESTVGPKDVQRAKEVLSQFDLVGILELFPATLEKLSRLTGKPWHEYSSSWLNKGENVIDSGTNENLALFDEFIWADNEVYQVALELFQSSS